MHYNNLLQVSTESWHCHSCEPAGRKHVATCCCLLLQHTCLLVL